MNFLAAASLLLAPAVFAGCAGSGLATMPRAGAAPQSALSAPHADGQRSLLYVSDQLQKAVLAFPSSEREKNPSPVKTIAFDVIPEGVWVDRSGILYVALSGSSSKQAGAVEEFKHGANMPFETITSGIGVPQCVLVDSAGTLYVDQINQLSVEILEYRAGERSPSKTLFITDKGEPEAGPMTLDSSGNLYVSAFFIDDPSGHAKIYRFAPGQTVARELRLTHLGRGGGLGIDAQGNLYAGDDKDGIAVYAPGQRRPSRTIRTVSGQVDALFTVTRSGELYVPSSTESFRESEILEYAAGGDSPVNEIANSLQAPFSVALQAAAF